MSAYCMEMQQSSIFMLLFLVKVQTVLCRGLHTSPKLQHAQAYPRTVRLDLIPCQISDEGFKITEKRMRGFQ